MMSDKFSEEPERENENTYHTIAWWAVSDLLTSDQRFGLTVSLDPNKCSNHIAMRAARDVLAEKKT
jgi:hypothetical protein